MPSEELLRRDLEAEFEVRSEPERVIAVRLMRWGDVAQTPQGPERFVRGAFRGIDPSTVTLEAIGPHGAESGVRLTGRGVELEERDDGPYFAGRVSRTQTGDELLELLRDRVYRRASIVFEPVPGGSRITRDGITERTRVNLARVGFVERAAYAGAEVLAVRSAIVPTETEPTPTPTPDPEPEPVPTPEPPPGVRVEVLARMDELRSDIVGRMVALEGGRGSPRTSHPLARFDSFVAFADAAFADPAAAPLLARALADQLSSESPGVIPPSWMSTVAGIITRPRPAITALGGPQSLGDTGMELDYPYLDPALNLDTVVAKQTAEKAQVASVKVKLLKGAGTIDTYAGGSDVSYQLIRRSSPAYREAYLRILAICYARTTEAAFEAYLQATATSHVVLTATATADQIRAALFDASSQVEDATGTPATVDLVSSAEFKRIGGLAGLWPTTYGTANVAGVADASTLRINVSGLSIVRAPFVTGNVHVITNGEAAAWHEDGPFPITAEDVSKLGQNVAIWGMGTSTGYIPKGIVTSTLT